MKKCRIIAGQIFDGKKIRKVGSEIELTDEEFDILSNLVEEIIPEPKPEAVVPDATKAPEETKPSAKPDTKKLNNNKTGD